MRTFALLLALWLLPALTAQEKVDYVADVKHATASIGKECGPLLKQKGINWKKVARQFEAEAATIKTHGEHLKLLTRLLARVRDGHASVLPRPAGRDVKWPDVPEEPYTGPGMFLCEIGKKVYVKQSFGDAAKAGIVAGSEIKKIDGLAVSKWLDARQAENADFQSFSTDHQARFHTLHWGLAAPRGTKMKLEIVTPKRKKKKRSLVYQKSPTRPQGPIVFPEETKGDKDLQWAGLPGGYGYIHTTRCPGDLPERVEKALAELGPMRGLVLDLRANSGGGFDHEGLMGRFIPEGKTLSFKKRYRSAGKTTYGGPVIVIIDGTVCSAGETLAAIFKEDGRGYVIGESPTAGMSSSKTTIELPSQLFALRVSVRSNMARVAKGQGLEGFGLEPHETLSYVPKDLAQGRDTLIERALAILKKGIPKKAVPYRPEQFGWSAPKK
jgi:carboxyl-terminal processing protease